MRLPAKCLLLLFCVCGSAPGLRAELLLGVPWSSVRELQAVGAADLRVRYVTGQHLFISGDRGTIRTLELAGLDPQVIDGSGPGDDYYVTRHARDLAALGLTPSYVDPAGWALLRWPQEGAGTPHFLWRLPEQYSLEGWLRPRRYAKPAAPLAASVEELVAQVDSVRLRQHLNTLALKDPDGTSERDNLHTRFVLRRETLEATEYIRQSLSAVLGEDAVEVQEFELDESRVEIYLDPDEIGFERRGRNVVGTLTGAGPEAGYYVVSAHYDAIGSRSPDWAWREDPAPGADDNATGVMLLLETARILAAQPLPWDVRFIAFGGEELGLLGSRAYVDSAVARGDEVLGVLNFDMFGYNDLADRVELVTNPASRWLVDLMIAANDTYDIGLRLDVLDDEDAAASDHWPFWVHGHDAILAIENYLPGDSTTAGVREGIYRVNNSYHTMGDVPDSVNVDLVWKCTQLAVATLAQYGLAEGLPNPAVFEGDLRWDGLGSLELRLSNIGTGLLDTPFQVRLSRCASDSTDCESIYDEEYAAPLSPGAADEITIPWDRYGETVFRLDIDTDDRVVELSEDDNQAFQQIFLRPEDRIVVYPNPFRAGAGRLLRFLGVPVRSRVRIYGLGGELVWSAQEDDAGQRRLGARFHEVLWQGVNQSGVAVGSGVYVYTITSATGAGEEKAKLAVVW